MKFTEEHQQIRETTRKVLQNEVAPFVDEWERAGIFPAKEVYKKLGDLGLLGIHKPVEYGGMGLDYSYNMAFVEELYHCGAGGVAMAIGVQTDMSTLAIARFGSHEIKRDFLAPAIAGDMVSCIAVTEPHAGSDVAAIKTTARKDGDDYIINGSKMFITSGTQADFIVVLCNTSDDGKHHNKSLIIVPANTPGVDRSTALKKLGQHSSDTAVIFFEDVRVPQSYLVGEEGNGFIMQMMQFQEERIWAAASSHSGMKAQIDHTLTYVQERKAFGKPLIANQVIQHRLVELYTEVALLKALTHEACETYVAGGDVSIIASMAKLKAGRLCREVPDACLQYMGGAGYMEDNPISRAYRDGRLGSIGGGADEIMCDIIAGTMGMNPR